MKNWSAFDPLKKGTGHDNSHCSMFNCKTVI